MYVIVGRLLKLHACYCRFAGEMCVVDAGATYE